MSGHNKWSKIKHKKAASDAKKSKIFSKFARLITVESKKSDGNKNSPGLRVAIEKARRENMPQNNIDRAIKKGVDSDVGAMDDVMYEAYGPGGVAVMIEGLTDNKNRTAAEIKHLLLNHNIQLAAPGSASWAFEKNNGEWAPKNTTPVGEEDSQKLEKLVAELEEHDDVQDIYTNAE